jgi:hypothetical protein
MRNHLKDSTQLRRHWRVFHQLAYEEKTIADRRNNYKVEYNVLKKREREREREHSESLELDTTVLSSYPPVDAESGDPSRHEMESGDPSFVTRWIS